METVMPMWWWLQALAQKHVLTARDGGYRNGAAVRKYCWPWVMWTAMYTHIAVKTWVCAVYVHAPVVVLVSAPSLVHATDIVRQWNSDEVASWRLQACNQQWTLIMIKQSCTCICCYPYLDCEYIRTHPVNLCLASARWFPIWVPSQAMTYCPSAALLFSMMYMLCTPDT